MKYTEVKFLCRLTTNATFSAYKGSMLRGCLGAALRRGVCMTRKQNCEECILARNCIFPRLFSPAPLKNAISAPPPFCLEPDLDERREYNAGEAFSFTLKLFSYAVEYLPFFVQAFRLAGERGMGNPPKTGHFLIEKIISGGESIFHAESDNLDIPTPQELPDIEELPDSSECGGLLLKIRAPLRHKSDNHFSANLEFADLLHLVLRRMKALHHLEGTDWNLPRNQYSMLWTFAKEAAIAENGLYWHEWTRYSSRQNSYMKFGGLMGEATYQGNLGFFRNFLRFASIAHIGKQTSFGLGLVDFQYL